LNRGVPAAKLSIGIPFFGYIWRGGGVTAPGQKWTSTPVVQQIYYRDIVREWSIEKAMRDPVALVPYVGGTIASSTYFLTYDDEWSIADKVRYAVNQRLGGWIIWELSADYLPGQAVTQPLLNTIGETVLLPRSREPLAPPRGPTR
jgi:chitinase